MTEKNIWVELPPGVRPIDYLNELKAKAEIISVCAQSNITPEELLGHKRHKEIVNARKKCAKLLRGLNFSYPKIAKIMNRDHSSIIHYIKPTPSHTPKRGFVEIGDLKS